MSHTPRFDGFAVEGGELAGGLHEVAHGAGGVLGADEVVLLDIPRWDFDWQMLYDPVEDIVVEPGDVVRIECSWDRSLRDPALEPGWCLVIWSCASGAAARSAARSSPLSSSRL